jgi:hypothetical protein
MPTYSVDQRLLSYLVDKRIIGELEQYIQRKAQQHDVADEGRRGTYSLTIADALGTETLKSVAEYLPAQLPDDVKSVTLAYGHAYPMIALTFSADSISRELNKLNIRLSSEHARESALGMRAEILHLLEGSRTRAHLLHLDFLKAMAVVGGGTSWCVLTFFKTLSPVAFKVFAAVAVPSTIYVILGLLLPYTAFDTKRNAARRGHIGKLVWLFISFVLITVLGVYWRNKQLGF